MSELQSIIFDKSKYSKARAIKWLKDHGFKHSGIDEKGYTYRFRQINPNKFKTMRTHKLTNGIKSIVGFN